MRWYKDPTWVVADLQVRPNALRLHKAIPLLWRGGRRSLTGWLWRVCTSIVSDHSPPVEGWQAQPDRVVVACLHQYSVGPFPSCGGVADISIL